HWSSSLLRGRLALDRVHLHGLDRRVRIMRLRLGGHGRCVLRELFERLGFGDGPIRGVLLLDRLLDGCLGLAGRFAYLLPVSRAASAAVSCVSASVGAGRPGSAVSASAAASCAAGSPVVSSAIAITGSSVAAASVSSVVSATASSATGSGLASSATSSPGASSA